MKKLKRLLLIHWHHYGKEIIDFEGINFITGKTATGKSTLIDALQLVLLGDTSGSFFNKAANDKSTRTLKSYLFCEEGDDGGAGFRYLRKSHFSSYVAVEFEDTERHKLFTCGLVCDCYVDGTYTSKWFVLHNMGFPENEFVDPATHTPYSIDKLKAYLRNRLGKKSGEFEFFDTNKRYQEVTLAKFGQMKQKYRTLLRKAVPFTPITDIEQFITESICDVRNNIDVEKMQSDIRHYKNLEEDAERISERIEVLKKIDQVNKEYLRFKNLYSEQSYVIARANVAEQEQEQQRLQTSLDAKETALLQCEQEIERISKELQLVTETRGVKDAEYRNSDILKKQQELEAKISALNDQIDRITQELLKATMNIQSYGKAWAACLRMPELQELEELKQHKGLLDSLEHINAQKIVELDFNACLKAFDAVKTRVQTYALELQKRAEQLRQDIVELRSRIENLKKGIKPYPERVMALKRMLEKHIFASFHKAVNIAPLADLLEIKNLQWQNAIEGYLAAQKFYLIVPAEYYNLALKLYNEAKKELGLYDVGLVNIAALRKNYNGAIAKNSLAEEIESSNSDALLYARFLLGKVVKCADVEELSSYKTAITASCMLYKNFVSRRINPKLYESPFIGRKAMELLLEQCQEKLHEALQTKAQLDSCYVKVSEAAKKPVLSEFEAAAYERSIANTALVPGLQEQIKSLEQELSSLDLLYLERLQKEIEQLKIQEYKLNSDKERLIEQRGSIREQVRNIKETKLPEVALLLDGYKQEIAANYDENWILTIGEPRYKDALKEPRANQSLKSSYERALKATLSQREKYKYLRTEQRSSYNSMYHMPFDVSREENTDFDNELISLSDVKLPEYLDKIKDAKEKAYVQFKDDFIAKIKSNIETVKQQIDELNTSLRQSVFGTDKYHFVIKARAEYQQYYNMITDPMLMDTGGWNLTSEAFNSKYQKEINELFNMLIINETNVSAEKRAEYERAIRKFTDYKTYLVFDLIVTNEQGFEQRLSKTILKKSGGETQIPFYIALLASFSQVCRVRNKNQNNTIRLIILDEAFSKMDGERIKESIPLLRRFGLQAIFSAPPDKIPDIAPLADRNVAVYKNGDYSFTRCFDPKALEEVEDLQE